MSSANFYDYFSHDIMYLIRTDNVSNFKTNDKSKGFSFTNDRKELVTVNGQEITVSLGTMAVKYRAISIISALKLPPSNKGEFGPLHMAFYENWEEGIVFLLKERHSLTTMDCFKKNPLAYFIEKSNLSFIPILINHFKNSDSIEKSSLANVYSDHEKSYSFLQYCCKLRSSRIINASSPFFLNGLITQDEYCSAIEQWNKDNNSYLPSFLQSFENKRKADGKVQYIQWQQPMEIKSSYANLEVSQYFDMKTVLSTFHILRSIVDPIRNQYLYPLYVNRDNILESYPDKLITNGSQYSCVTLGNDLKCYFEELIAQNLLFHENEQFFVPINGNSAIWSGFGIVLSHIGFTGCHYQIPPLHPLVYSILYQKDLNSYSKSEIEDFFTVTQPDLIRDFRKNVKAGMFIGLSDINDLYNQIINPKWIDIIAKHKKVLKWIHEGFYSNCHEEDSRQCRHYKKFLMFISQAQMKVPALRLWYEGFSKETLIQAGEEQNNFEQSECNRFDFKDRIHFDFACETGASPDWILFDEFIEEFLKTLQENPKSQDFFVSAFCTSSMIPFCDKSCKIVISQSRFNSTPSICFPGMYVILPCEIDEIPQMFDRVFSIGFDTSSIQEFFKYNHIVTK